MSLGINKPEINLLDNEVLRVTPDGQFIWYPDADRMIEEGDYSASPAIPHILRALRKSEWVGLTDEDIAEAGQLNVEGSRMLPYSFARAIEAVLKEKNSGQEAQ